MNTLDINIDTHILIYVKKNNGEKYIIDNMIRYNGDIMEKNMINISFKITFLSEQIKFTLHILQNNR